MMYQFIRGSIILPKECYVQAMGFDEPFTSLAYWFIGGGGGGQGGALAPPPHNIKPWLIFNSIQVIYKYS